MNSIVSYEERGKWGNANWRGNCSGYLIKDIIEQFHPKYFVDVCEGSGTSRDVISDLFPHIEYTGLDLHTGFDFTFDYVLSKLKRPADIVFSHPPYGRIVKYLDDVRDLSNCASTDSFLEKAQMLLLNQREATRKNGFYMTLIGDTKKQGVLTSYQAHLISLMPKDELVNVVIKQQHHCVSDRTVYSGNFIPINHEYLLIWKKKEADIWNICFNIASHTKKAIASTWRNAIRIVMAKLNGKAMLSDIYLEVEKVAAHLIENNKHWKAKIRQILQKNYKSVSRGEWAV